MKRNYTVIPAFLFLIIAFGACKKTNPGPTGGNTNNYGDPLIAESSGWKRVGSVSNSNKYTDQLAINLMTGYDLTVTGSKIQVLYSEDKFEGGDKFSFYHKASFTEGSSTSPVIAEILNFPAFYIKPTLYSYRPVFRPGTFNMETMRFSHNAIDPFNKIELLDEATNSITNQHPFFDASLSAKMLPNGDILAGDINYNGLCELDYYNRATNTWKYINQSAGDSQWHMAYTPFLLDDGQLLAFRLYSKTGKAFLSVADFVYTAAFPAAPYTARFDEEHPEYAPTSYDGVKPQYAGNTVVAGYTTAGNSVTVVLRYQDNVSKAYSISAYKWTEGATSLQKLYSAISISSALGDMLTKRDQTGCNTDGSIYALLNVNQTYQLTIAGAGGEKNYGAFSTNTPNQRYAVTLNCLRNINGAYYAVATPTYGGNNYLGQHLDVVKLVL